MLGYKLRSCQATKMNGDRHIGNYPAVEREGQLCLKERYLLALMHPREKVQYASLMSMEL